MPLGGKPIKGIDDVRQMTAIRIWKRNPRFCSTAQWKAYCMRTSRSICASEHRRRYNRPFILPLHAEEEFTGFAIPVEELAALKHWKEQRAEQRRRERTRADLALLDLMQEGFAGTTPTEQKILQTILSMAEEGNFLKVTKQGRSKVKQGALGEALGVSKGTVSRNLESIRDRAAGAPEMDS